MPNKGSYQWWRDNYRTDAEWARVSGVLTAHGVDCKSVEIDHFPPNASYTGSRFDRMLAYGARPAAPLPKYVHRYHSGGGGMGGHASTTGKTFVSTRWTGELRAQMAAGNFYGAMKQDIVDKKNLALYWAQDRELLNGLLVPAVQLAHEEALISETELYDLLLDLNALA